MKKLIVIPLIVIIWVFSIKTLAQESLSDFLSRPDCSSSCWLGIEIDMSEEDVLQIFTENNIEYLKSTYSTPGLADYGVTGGYTHHYIYPGSEVMIFVWVYNNVVVSIDLTVNNISLEQVIAEYGSPTHILKMRGMDTTYLVYFEKNLVFSVYDDLVVEIGIKPQDTLISAYINDPFSEIFPYCADASHLCAVVTATPNPDLIPTKDAARVEDWTIFRTISMLLSLAVSISIVLVQFSS